MGRKILIGIGVLVVVLISAVFISLQLAKQEPPPLLAANFVDLNQISKISKFRSCAGHTVVPQDGREMKRSMKHYFWVKDEYLGTDKIPIYSPYEGLVSVIRSEPGKGLEGEIWIAPKGKFAMLPPFGRWMFSVQHINVRQDLKVGSQVKEGEIIGYAYADDKGGDSFDIVYAKSAVIPKKIDNWTAPFEDLDSVFNRMSEEVFKEYQARGLTKEDLVLTKEARDQKPCTYDGNGPNFESEDDSLNWTELR